MHFNLDQWGTGELSMHIQGIQVHTKQSIKYVIPSKRSTFEIDSKQTCADSVNASPPIHLGRTEEAEAVFELAKALEAQLEESAAHDSTTVAPVDDVAVEGLLDPEILPAIRAIGIEVADTSSQGPGRPEPSKPSVGKSDNVIQDRSNLEEQIKAEKVKALNLKRAGKQAEALNALRRAKMLEKKLNSSA